MSDVLHLGPGTLWVRATRQETDAAGVVHTHVTETYLGHLKSFTLELAAQEPGADAAFWLARGDPRRRGDGP